MLKQLLGHLLLQPAPQVLDRVELARMGRLKKWYEVEIGEDLPRIPLAGVLVHQEVVLPVEGVQVLPHVLQKDHELLPVGGRCNHVHEPVESGPDRAIYRAPTIALPGQRHVDGAVLRLPYFSRPQVPAGKAALVHVDQGRAWLDQRAEPPREFESLGPDGLIVGQEVAVDHLGRGVGNHVPFVGYAESVRSDYDAVLAPVDPAALAEAQSFHPVKVLIAEDLSP